MDKPTHVLLVVGLTLGIVVAGLFIAEKKPRIDCWNWFGLAKGCEVHTAPNL